jgi:hypothetical protein
MSFHAYFSSSCYSASLFLVARGSTLFSLMEVLPAPFGMIPPAGSSSVSAVGAGSGVRGTAAGSASMAVDVCVSGALTGWAGGLVPGYPYYTNTMGDIIQGTVLLGRQPLSDAGAEYSYVYDAVSETFLSSESVVGLATDDATLIVKAK